MTCCKLSVKGLNIMLFAWKRAGHSVMNLEKGWKCCYSPEKRVVKNSVM
jgi:hypothetical protein